MTAPTLRIAQRILAGAWNTVRRPCVPLVALACLLVPTGASAQAQADSSIDASPSPFTSSQTITVTASVEGGWDVSC